MNMDTNMYFSGFFELEEWMTRWSDNNMFVLDCFRAILELFTANQILTFEFAILYYKVYQTIS